MIHPISSIQMRETKAWKHPARRIGVVVSALILVASLGSGCATAASKREDAQRRRQATSHFNIGVDHLENGRLPYGLREFLIAESRTPKDPYIQYGLGRAYVGLDRDALAERHLLRALKVYPDFHDARLTLSGLYLVLERWSDAVEQAEILLDDPTFPYPWTALTNIGWAHFREGRPEEARVRLRKALKYNPAYWQSQLNLGILEAQEGHKAAALKAYAMVLELKASPSAVAEANYRSAEILMSLGKRKRAVRHFMAAAAQSPEGQWGQKSEELLEVIR